MTARSGRIAITPAMATAQEVARSVEEWPKGVLKAWCAYCNRFGKSPTARRASRIPTGQRFRAFLLRAAAETARRGQTIQEAEAKLLLSIQAAVESG